MSLDINASLATFKMFTDFAQQRVDEGKGKIGIAFKNAEKDDVNHQHDGHKKVTANKL